MIFVVACGDNNGTGVGDTIAVTGITLSRDTHTMTVGQEYQFTATVAPANATDSSVTWRSSNPAVATVSDTGLVSALLKAVL